jgi:hypothetical protein
VLADRPATRDLQARLGHGRDRPPELLPLDTEPPASRGEHAVTIGLALFALYVAGQIIAAWLRGAA